MRNILFLVGAAAASCPAVTVTLQNGTDGYNGCADAFVYNRHSSSGYIASVNEVAQGTKNFMDIEEDQA